jgi:hypothetical protein
MKMKSAILGLAALVAAGSLHAASAQHVGKVADGYWKGDWPYSGNVVGYNDRNVWIDLWVHNLGFHKEVGIVWTDNDWADAHWTAASYEFSYTDGAEQWGVDLLPAGKFMWHRSSAHGWVELDGDVQIIRDEGRYIDYAIYYHDVATGAWYWDNNGGQNHRL